MVTIVKAGEGKFAPGAS